MAISGVGIVLEMNADVFLFFSGLGGSIAAVLLAMKYGRWLLLLLVKVGTISTFGVLCEREIVV